MPVALDIKESAQQGMGPHGLVIGATGSGKSELLRTLVLALAMTHSPEALNFVLVDFKGGATFAGMADMPHVSAVITNLGQELTLVDRMQDALQGEMTRRQELLRAAGNFANVTDYERARAGGADLEPLPALLIVADEFSELLAAKPEFAELFVAIGRLGRSLSMHLLLVLAAARGGPAARAGVPPVLPHRPADLLGRRVAHRHRRPRRLRAAAGAGPGLPQVRPDDADPVQGRLRLRAAEGPPAPARRSAGAGATAPAEILPFTLAPVSRRAPRARVEPVGTPARPSRAEDAGRLRHRGRAG